MFSIQLLTLFTIGNNFDVVLGGYHDGEDQQGDHDVRSGNHVTDKGQHDQEARYERTEQAGLFIPEIQRPVAQLPQFVLHQRGHL